MSIRHFLNMGVAGLAIWIPVSASAQAVEGFGKNVPLSIAARQVVPSDVLVNIDSSIDKNSRISWKGGSDWHKVIEDIAAQKGATVEYIGQLVKIVPAGTSVMTSGVPVATAAPSLSRGGLIVLSPQATPLMQQGIQVATPVLQVATPVPVNSPAIITSVPAAPQQGAITVVPPRSGSPSVTVVQPASPAGTSTPGPVVIVQTPAAPAMQVSVPDQPNVRESAKQRTDRLRAEREEKTKSDREARLHNVSAGRIDPPIRNAQPTPRQVMTSGTWKAVKGETLDQILGDWADKAGWTLAFNSQVFYEIQAGAEFSGEFTEAVASLIRSIRARPVPVATFYKGNKVLVVSNNVDGN